MKKLLLFLAFVGLVACNENKPSKQQGPTDPSELTYVDLGLQSGTKWASTPIFNPAREDGTWSYEEAMARFSDHLPTMNQFRELLGRHHLDWVTDRETGAQGLKIEFPDGTTLFLPAITKTEYTSALYISSTLSKENPETDFMALRISEDEKPYIMQAPIKQALGLVLLVEKVVDLPDNPRDTDEPSDPEGPQEPEGPKIPDGFIDLGLPSGTYWAINRDINPEDPDDLYTYSQAMEAFPDQVPTASQFEELLVNTDVTYVEEELGYSFTANGQTLFLPMAGYRLSGGSYQGKGTEGSYVTATTGPTANDGTVVTSFDFGTYSGGYPQLYHDNGIESAFSLIRVFEAKEIGK